MDCFRVLRGQYSGKIRFAEKKKKNGVQDEGWGDEGGGKSSSETRVAYPEVKVQVRDLVRVVGILAPFDLGGVGSREESVLSSSLR